VLQISNLLLDEDFSSEVANNSAVGMIGSFIAAALLIVIPATAFLIFVSQKDSRSHFYWETLVFVEVLSTLYIGDLNNPLKNKFLEKECGQC